ncbi:MAG: amidohydrolase family protein [Desulfobulbaceae bacterium]|nr:amidohydrolase family protein [Desulfobulbaceae bacterium]
MNKPHYILAGSLIDGSGGPIRKRVLLEIGGGTIAGIQNCDSWPAPPPEQVTDLSHCCILPRFVDSHVHLCLSGSVDPSARKRQLAAPYRNIRSVISRHLHDHFTHGVAAVRDGGDSNGYTRQYRDDPDQAPVPVLLKTAGKAWHRKGRYGGLLGRSPADNETLPAAYSLDHDVIDHVKLIQSGINSLLHFARETAPQFTSEEIRGVVELAVRKGRKVMVHANGRSPVRSALEAGCHSIEHGWFMGRDNLERMAEKRIFWVPTAFAMKACLDHMVQHGNSCDPAVVEKNLHHQLEHIAFARKCGVTVALGTDSGCFGVFHGKAVVEELKLLIKGGYSLPEAVRCATFNGARLLGVEKETGLIAAGRSADFIVVRGTPARLPGNLSRPEAIYMKGNACRKDSFLKI